MEYDQKRLVGRRVLGRDFTDDLFVRGESVARFAPALSTTPLLRWVIWVFSAYSKWSKQKWHVDWRRDEQGPKECFLEQFCSALRFKFDDIELDEQQRERT